MFEQKPIPKFVGAIMIIGALIIDVVELLASGFAPVVGDIASLLVSAIGYGIYYLWFKLGYGINLTSPKKMLSMLGGGLVEAVGIVLPADLPGLTISVVLVIIFSKVPAVKVVIEGPRGALSARKAGSAAISGQARDMNARQLLQKTEQSRGMEQRLRNQPRSFARNIDPRIEKKTQMGVATALERSHEAEISRVSTYRKTVRKNTSNIQRITSDNPYRKSAPKIPSESPYRKAA